MAAPLSPSSAVILNHISSHFLIPFSDSSLICTVHALQWLIILDTIIVVTYIFGMNNVGRGLTATRERVSHWVNEMSVNLTVSGEQSHWVKLVYNLHYCICVINRSIGEFQWCVYYDAKLSSCCLKCTTWYQDEWLQFLWHLHSDQATLRQNRCLRCVLSVENPPHPIHLSCD